MRTLLITLMIVLLPLRGWASDVMAVSMAAQQLYATNNVANNQDSTLASGQSHLQAQAGMLAECPMLAQSQDGNGKVGPILLHGCTTCQLCMALVTGYSSAPFVASALPQAARGIDSVSFTSAERAPGYKPPIS